MAMSRGTAKSDRLLGTETNDTIYGFDGPDTLIGSAGNDRLYGGNGVDFLYGDAVPGKPAGVGTGTGTVTVAAGATNDSIAHALDITDDFRLFEADDVTNSAVLPHVSIGAVGNGHLDYYALTVNAGITVTLDIDHTQNIDTHLSVLDATGTVIAENDDAVTPDADGSVTDSALTFVAPTQGTYYFQVSDSIDPTHFVAVPGASAYTLQVAVVDVPDVGDGNGADFLDGGAGADVMVGGAGNDLYVVDDAGDQVFERPGQGSDRVLATVDYTLAAGQAIETLTTRSSLDTAPINLTGNELANSIWGDAGNNILDGGAGADSLYGRKGDDSYYVDNAHDRVGEAVGEGNDTVVTSVSYTLAHGQEIETLVGNISDADTYRLTGNEFDNTIIANVADEYPYRGYTILDGGAGADTMIVNGLGSNISVFYVDNPRDVVINNNDPYNTKIYASGDYMLSDSVGQIITFAARDATATTPLHLTGNSSSNGITGNAGNNTLYGGGGIDGLAGLGGADTFMVNAPIAGNKTYIADFTASGTDHDLIGLSRSLFGALAPGGTVTVSEFSTTYDNNPDVRLIYTKRYDGYGSLVYDPDGSGSAAAIEIAQLRSDPVLTTADFVITG